MLKTEKLSIGYDKKILIDDINLEVKPGKIVTLIGPNGSGKSTVLKTITGMLAKLGGKISIAGKDSDLMKEKDLSTKVSMVLTEKLQPEMMSCREVIATGRYPYTGRLGILGDEDWKAVDRAIEITDCGDIQEKDFNRISDGQKQRVMLARAICQDTEIIVLDEPTSYLDLYYKLDLMKIILTLAKKENKAVLMSLHELDLVKKVSDVVVCVDGKKAVKAGTPEEIFSGDFIQSLYGLKKDEFDAENAVLRLDCTRDWSGRGALAEGTEVMKAEAGTAESPAGGGSDEGTGAGGGARKNKHAKILMVQGTMSSAGKSLLVAGLCRVFKQDGFRVAPFKSQNMALNSFITKEGLEMGRAQVMQAEACGIEPEVCMNPVLLKPTNDRGSQVIVNGEVLGNMEAREYFKYKKSLMPEILKAFEKLEQQADIIVIEGAGSPAEINLRENDIVNMGLAEVLDAPVLLVGDIDRGGVFAQLLGTVSLLSRDERKRVKGLVINKFRGDKSILDPGIEMLEEKAGIPVTGVLPFLKICIDDEDSLSGRFGRKEMALVNLGVVKFPRISNFSDFSVFEQLEDVAVHYISDAEEIEKMDMVILPGSKNTLGDLKWLRESGLESAVKKFADNGGTVFGICGGYQMLGNSVSDPDFVEEGGTMRGLELLDMETVLLKEKTRKQVEVQLDSVGGVLSGLSGKKVCGYEIHMGKSCEGAASGTSATSEISASSGSEGALTCGGAPSGTSALAGEGASSDTSAPSRVLSEKGSVYGTYIHGFFDEGDLAFTVCSALARKKGVTLTEKKSDYRAFKESQYDLLADAVRKYMDMEAVYGMLRQADF